MLTSVSRTTINHLFALFRKRTLALTTPGKKMNGNVEVDESYFGPKRVRGKKGRGAFGKTIVLGILKRNDKVHVSIIKHPSRAEIMPIIKGCVLLKSHSIH